MKFIKIAQPAIPHPVATGYVNIESIACVDILDDGDIAVTFVGDGRAEYEGLEASAILAALEKEASR